MQSGRAMMLSRRRFDVDEYQAMLRAGILSEDDRVELIEGEIVQMSAVGVRHAACVRRLTRLLVGAVEDPGRLSIQNPVRLDAHSEPEPDVVLLRERDDDYSCAHPRPEDVLLLVEVADSSLPFDRGVKLPLYARAGVVEVWIVDLDGDAIEVHRAPEGEGFRLSQRVTDGRIAAAAFPHHAIGVAEVLAAGG